MRKLLGLLIFLAGMALPAAAQYTTVTAAAGIQDSAGVAYVNGNYSIVLSNPTGQIPYFQGSKLPGTQARYVGSLSSTGTLSVVVPSNAFILAGTNGPANQMQWTFSICSSANTGCFSTNISISGATQDVASTLSAASPHILFPVPVGWPSAPSGDCPQASSVLGSMQWNSSCGGGGGATWPTLSGGTNTSSTFVCGTGCSLTPGGTGTVGANQVNGAAVVVSAAVIASNSSGQLIAATTTGSGSTVVLNNGPTLIAPALGTVASGVLTNATGLPLSGTVGGAAPSGQTYNFTAVTQILLRVAAGLTTSTNGDIGYDTTNKNWHAYQNGVDSYLFSGPVSGTYTNNDCVKFGVASGVITLVDAGAACGSGSGGANTALSNLAAVAINTSLLPGTTATIDLGSSSFAWRNLYYSGSLINTGSGAVTVQGDTGTCTGATGLGTLCFSSTGNRPVYDYNLGGFSNLILASDFPTSAFLLASNGSNLPIAATSTANTLAGFNSGGTAADVAIGSGLSLSSGTLSATGGAPALNAITSPTATNAVSMAGFGWGLTANVAQTVAMLTLTGDNAAEAFPLLSVVQGGTSDTSTPISVVLKNPASAALILEGASGQSGFIFEVENNTPTVLAGIDQNFNLEVESGVYAHNQGNFTMTSEGNSSPIQLRTGTLPSSIIQAGSEVGGTNAAGTSSYMSADTSTGNAAMAQDILYGSIKAASGATLQTQVQRYLSNLRTTITTNNTAQTIMTATVASGTTAGGKIAYCVHMDNGTDYQMVCGEVTYGLVNKGGTVTAATMTATTTASAVSTGTLTVTWASSAATPSNIQVTANSSLTPTTMVITWSVENFSDANDITPTVN